MRPRLAPSLLFVLLAALPAGAEVLDYPLDLPPGEVAYRIPFDIRYPGTVVVDASWTGGRVIAFRIEDPGGTHSVVRVSGPSPQRFKVQIAAGAVAGGPVQRVLRVKSLDARDPGSGKVTLTLPDDPVVVRAREEAAKPKPPPPPPPDPWTVPMAAPPLATPAMMHVFDAVEAFRVRVIAKDGTRNPDACGWQDALLRQLASGRDTQPPDAGAKALLEAIANGVATVETLRTSRDPILAGMPPEPGLRQRAWASLREQKLRPIHRDLDGLTEHASRGVPPSLQGASWPARMVACLVSGERQIENTLAERGPEADPGPAPEQHATLLRAAEAFRALLAAQP